jgi:large subunit ribosomal protein L5
MDNPMRKIFIAKVTINVGVGKGGEDIERAKKLIERISGKDVIITKSHKRSTFGVAKGRPLGIKTTIRGEAALKFIKNALEAVDNKLKAKSFDKSGNFSFGIKEYIDIPGVKYDPDLGIIGMDVCVTFRRPGFRVSKKRIRPAKIGKTHKIKPEDAMEWSKKNLGVVVE